MPGPPVFGARTSATTSATSVSPTMPAASEDDLLLVVVTCAGGGTLSTASSGWVHVGSANNGTSQSVGVFAGKQGEASALTVTSTANSGKAWFAESYSNADDPATVQMSSSTGTGGGYDPPACTPTHGSHEYMWVAAAAGDRGGDWAPSSGPSGWSGFAAVQSGTGASTAEASLGIARLQSTGTTVDPGTFGSGRFSGAAYTAVTIGVLPLLVTPIDATGDSLDLTEGPLSLSVAGSVDTISLEEGSASVEGETVSSPDEMALAEDPPLITVDITADSLTIDDDLTSLTVVVSDVIYIEDGSERVIPPPVSDIITLAESAMVTNLVEPVPDSISMAENPAEVIIVKIVADEIHAAETQSVTATVPALDELALSDAINGLTLSADDAMLLTDVGFNFGDGLKAKGPRVCRIDAEDRTFRPNVVNRVNVILAEGRTLKVR